MLGGPGSGKGSMCELLSKDFEFAHLSAGELLRKETTQDTPLANEIKSLMKEGKIVDGNITC